MSEDWLSRADDYEIHVFLFFEFRCSDCNGSAAVESDFDQASEEWCGDVSRQARVAGWVMPPDKDQIGELDQPLRSTAASLTDGCSSIHKRNSLKVTSSVPRLRT